MTNDQVPMTKSRGFRFGHWGLVFRHFLRASAPLREIVICLLIAAAARAENWERFRGPNGAGQSDDTTIPSTWEPENFIWKQSLPGVGHGSPVIWDHKLFLISADTAAGTQFVSAYDTTSGAPLWQKKLDADKYHTHSLNSMASSTPAADADAVYVLWLAGGEVSLVAFSHNGDEVWRHDVGPFQEQHGFGVSPIVVDDVVIVSRNSGAASGVTAFDRKTGDVRWNIPHEPGIAAFSTPCLLDPAAGQKQLLATSTAAGLSSIDPSCGKVVWQGFTDELSQRCVNSPFVANGMIFVGCGQGGNGKLLLAVRPGSETAKPQEAYRIDKQTPQVPTPIVAGDLLFLWTDKGIVSCYDINTHEQYWRERIGGDFHSSPIRIGNRILGISRQGDAVVLAADKKYNLLARNSLKELCVATPAVANHRLFIRTDATLMCIGDPKVRE